MFPITQASDGKFTPEEFRDVMMSDFRGGLNITDPAVSLPQNQFDIFTNFYLNRQGQMHSRPPYRPMSFASSTADREVAVNILDNDWVPTTIEQVYVLRQTVTDYSYNGELFVIAGKFRDILAVENDTYMVVVFNSTTNKWLVIWSSATASNVSVTPFRINAAYDLIIFPDDTTPLRWTPSLVSEAVTGITLAADGLVLMADTSSFAVGDNIFLTGMTGPDEIEDITFTVKAIDPNVSLSVENDWTSGVSAWVSGGTCYGYSVTSALGLTKPVVDAFAVTYTQEDNTDSDQAVDCTDNPTIYYKFSYFYDDSNTSTKFGESEAGTSTDGDTSVVSDFVSEAITGLTIADDKILMADTSGFVANDTIYCNDIVGPTDLNGIAMSVLSKVLNTSLTVSHDFAQSAAWVSGGICTKAKLHDQQIKIAIAEGTSFIPAGVLKIKIYRSPMNTVEGPYRFVGETDFSTPPDGAGNGVVNDFYDRTPWDHEGIENLPDDTDPSTASLNILNVYNVGPYLVGFDATMVGKLIWSSAASPDVWNPLSFDYLDGVGKIAIAFNRKIYIFTSDSTWQKETMNNAAVKICNIGSIDGRSVQDVGSGLMWADYDSVYFADFVQQYGSKGDFPRDDGYPISKSIRRRSSSASIDSAFFERRYYITFVDSIDSIRKCFVFDVDYKSWALHSMDHEFITRGTNKLYSFGTTIITYTTESITGSGGGGANVLLEFGTGNPHYLAVGNVGSIQGTSSYDAGSPYAINDVASSTSLRVTNAATADDENGVWIFQKSYMFEHDYDGVVAIVAGYSDYEGKDYHDYSYIMGTTLEGLSTTLTAFKKSAMLLSGDFRKTFVSSVSLLAEGVYLSANITLGGEGDTLLVSKAFSDSLGIGEVVTFPALWNTHGSGRGSNWAEGAAAAAAATADYNGWVGATQGSASLHKKFRRLVKSNQISLNFSSVDTRELKIIAIGVYAKSLPKLA